MDKAKELTDRFERKAASIVANYDQTKGRIVMELAIALALNHAYWLGVEDTNEQWLGKDVQAKQEDFKP